MNSKDPFPALYNIARRHLKKIPINILSLGCGPNAIEAIRIAKLLPESNIVGIDKNLKEPPRKIPRNCSLTRADFLKANLEKNNFDLVYCFHVLEHINKNNLVFKTISSILSKGGAAIIGFPNRDRLIGYINPSTDISNLERIKSNFSDYKKRITGRFNNKYAHAGFARAEFENAAKKYFTSVRSVAKEYYILKYPRLGWIVRIMDKTKMGRYIFPSNYFLLIK
jgi:ubiquinone/menaquinone biosynthesis C-methylase UbiE